MSDIFIKTSPQGSGGWQKAIKIFIKTAAQGTAGWASAKAVFLKTTANGLAGWLRVWPTSGVFSTRNPWISLNSGDPYSSRLTNSDAVRIGTRYYGNNAEWDPNGFIISTYTYQWEYYDSGENTANRLGTLSGPTTASGWTTTTGQVELPASIWTATNSTNLDRKYLAFQVTASPSNDIYKGTDESTRIKVVRRVPRITSGNYNLSVGPYNVGTTISYSSSWDIDQPYKIDSNVTRTSLGLIPGYIKWYYVNNLSNIYASGSRIEITRAADLYSWTIQSSDNLGGKYIIAEETVFNSGSDYEYGNNGFTNGANQVTIATSTAVVVEYPPNNPTALYTNAVSKDSFFIGWTKSTIDPTHSAATSYDYGVNQSSTTPPSTLVTGVPTNGQYRNKSDNDTNAYELVSNLSEGTTYYGWVRANNGAGPSSWVRTSAVTTLISKPPNPVGSLTHDSASRTQTSLRFTWTAPFSDATHNVATKYIYHINTANVEPAIVSYLGFIDGGGTPGQTQSITVTGLTANTLYYFFIRAGNDDGYSSVQTSSGTTLAVLNPPLPPTSANLTIPSTSGMTLGWTQGGGGNPTSYEVAFSTSTTPPTTTSLSTWINNWYDVGLVNSYRAVGLNNGTTYYAWVRAKNSDGTSGPSNRPSLATRTFTISNPSWVASTNFQRNTSVPFMRWGWDNGTASTSGTGTGSGMTINGFFYEIYTTATGTTLWDSGFRIYRSINSTLLVNGLNFIYVQNYNNSSSPVYTSSARFGRIQMEAYDYDVKTYLAPWTGRI